MAKDSELDYVEYQELGSEQERRLNQVTARSRWVAGFAVLFLLFSAAVNTAIWVWVTEGPRDALDEDWNHCGRSSAEAMRRGCVMEPLFYGWMPQQCVYQNLSDRYPVFEDRKWYLEQDLINEIPPASLWNGTNAKVYTHIYHGEHCLFQWRKMMFAMDNQQPYIDNKTISIHHSSHCADQLTEGREGKHAVNEVELGFYRCRNTLWAG